MTTYKEIFGKPVKVVSSDPTDAGAEGQIWYNSTLGSFRSVVSVGAWSSAAPLGTGRYTSGSFGNQTAGVVVGGTASGTKLSNVEHYDGIGFSSATAFPAGINSGSGAGTQTAGLIAGGNSPSRTNAAFKYDGSSWTAANNLPGVMDNLANCGTETQSNVIMAVGRTPATGNSGTNQSVTFDGTNFASGPSTNTARMFNTTSGAGTGTAGLIIGGFIDPSPNAMTNCEEYDGSSWTNTGSLNVATGFATAFGTQTNAVTQVNSPNYEGSEQYNGSTWAALPNIGVTSPGGLYGTSAGATGNAGWISSMSPTVNKTAEWNFTANTVTAGAWASGGAMSTARQDGGGFGTQTAAAVVGGETPSITNATEHYNGSSWTSGGNYPVSYTKIGTFGIQTAGVGYGGNQAPGAAQNTTAEYDGSSWTAVNNYPISISASRGCGVLTAGLAVAGDTFPPTSGRNSTTSKEYDGTNWTAGGSLGTGGYAGMVAGTQTAAVIVGGTNRVALTEEYDGSSWTAGGAPIINMSFGGSSSAGTQDNMTTFVTNSSPNSFVQKYNGTSFATEPSIATGRYAGTGAGTAAAALAIGGRQPAFSTATEEFTPETTTANVETLTSS